MIAATTGSDLGRGPPGVQFKATFHVLATTPESDVGREPLGVQFKAMSMRSLQQLDPISAGGRRESSSRQLSMCSHYSWIRFRPRAAGVQFKAICQVFATTTGSGFGREPPGV